MIIYNNLKIIAHNGGYLAFVCTKEDCDSCKHKFRCFSEEFLFTSYKELDDLCKKYNYDLTDVSPSIHLMLDRLLFDSTSSIVDVYRMRNFETIYNQRQVKK